MLKAPSSGFLIGCPERGTAKAASLPPMPLLCSMVQNLRTDNGQRCCRLDSKCFIPARLPQLQLVIASLSNAWHHFSGRQVGEPYFALCLCLDRPHPPRHTPRCCSIFITHKAPPFLSFISCVVAIGTFCLTRSSPGNEFYDWSRDEK